MADSESLSQEIIILPAATLAEGNHSPSLASVPFIGLPPPPRGPKKARSRSATPKDGTNNQALSFRPSETSATRNTAFFSSPVGSPSHSGPSSIPQIILPFNGPFYSKNSFDLNKAALGLSHPKSQQNTLLSLSSASSAQASAEDYSRNHAQRRSSPSNQRYKAAPPRNNQMTEKHTSDRAVAVARSPTSQTVSISNANSDSQMKPSTSSRTITQTGAEMEQRLPDSLTIESADSKNVSIFDVSTPLQPSLPRSKHAIRPLISHAHRNSDSERSTISFTSSNIPPSTDSEPRISISSTVYSSSNYSNSLQSHLYRTGTPEPPNFLPSSPSRDSFIDMFSPTTPHFSTFTATSTSPVPPIAAGQPSAKLELHPPSSVDVRSSKRPKPLPRALPIPPTRSSPVSPISRSYSNVMISSESDLLPPTTNNLSAQERADLVRKTRKLAQMFGQIPSADVVALQAEDPSILYPTALSHGRHRAVASMSDGLRVSSDSRQTSVAPAVWPPIQGTQYISANGRRHSTPLTPDNFSFLEYTSDVGNVDHGHRIEIGNQEGVPEGDWSGHFSPNQDRADSPTSFIDLSEEDITTDDISAIIAETPKRNEWRRGLLHSPSTPSLFEYMGDEERSEKDKLAKVNKLAKLHRFLGSRVPTDLVLGLTDTDASLPPLASSTETSALSSVLEDEDARKTWLRRRRSSSAVFPPNWSDDRDRLKEDLNDKEKAINVRRAQKMEKVFGVLPPQTLYHTRHSPSPSAPNIATSKSQPPSRSSPTAPLSPAQVSPSSPVPIRRNWNQSAYSKLTRNRPGTAESSKQLLPSKGRESFEIEADHDRRASVFLHYQHSLHSLNDIIDRDDKASLAELHEYLNSEVPEPFALPAEHRASVTASVKFERRRSLPARTSIMSISSEYSLASPRPEVTDFQLRRRRAAKLTHFFGVDYRDLIQDVLESIEKGVEEEKNRGTLNPREVEDLLQKLRKLKTKRGGLSYNM